MEAYTKIFGGFIHQQQMVFKSSQITITVKVHSDELRNFVNKSIHSSLIPLSIRSWEDTPLSDKTADMQQLQLRLEGCVTSTRKTKPH